MREFERRLQDGDVLLLDGATGTELERRGADMNAAAWCALATFSMPALLRTIHEDYIRAGADVITANTYASSRLMFEAADAADCTAEIVTACRSSAAAAASASITSKRLADGCNGFDRSPRGPAAGMARSGRRDDRGHHALRRRLMRRDRPPSCNGATGRRRPAGRRRRDP